MTFSRLSALIRLCRPRHWIKNALIFAPLVFSGRLSDAAGFAAAFYGWVAFGLYASAVYVFNDLRDVESDRRHEIKKNRPLASGAVSVASARVLAVLLFCAGTAVNLCVAPDKIAATLPILYILLNILYSAGVKKVPLADVAVLVSGFLIRVFYGGFLVHAAVSVWLYLTVTAMAACLGLGKRRNELLKRIKSGDEIDGVLQFYTPAFLDKNMYMCLTLAIAFYALWAIAPIPAMPDPANARVWSVPVVLLICMRYSLLIERESYADPVDVLFSDRALQGLVAFYGLFMLLIMYG